MGLTGVIVWAPDRADSRCASPLCLRGQRAGADTRRRSRRPCWLRAGRLSGGVARSCWARAPVRGGSSPRAGLVGPRCWPVAAASTLPIRAAVPAGVVRAAPCAPARCGPTTSIAFGRAPSAASVDRVEPFGRPHVPAGRTRRAGPGCMVGGGLSSTSWCSRGLRRARPRGVVDSAILRRSSRAPAIWPCSRTSAPPTTRRSRSRSPAGHWPSTYRARRPGLGSLLGPASTGWWPAPGAVLPAKDARLAAGRRWAAMYPRLAEWRADRDRVDPRASLAARTSRARTGLLGLPSDDRDHGCQAGAAGRRPLGDRPGRVSGAWASVVRCRRCCWGATPGGSMPPSEPASLHGGSDERLEAGWGRRHRFGLDTHERVIGRHVQRRGWLRPWWCWQWACLGAGRT